MPLAVRGPIITRSELGAPRARVWDHVTTVRGINDELAPWLRMTATRDLRANGIAAVGVGQRVCRSWVLLLGVLPIDYDDITLERLDPPRGFLERSTMLSQRAWEHERTLEPSGAAGKSGVAGSSCVITDQIRYEPRVAVPDAILRGIYTAIFRHRHRRLRRRFGGRALE